MANPILHTRPFGSVVVLEDDAATAESIRHSLDQAGFKIHWVESAEGALRLAETESVQAFILDVNLGAGRHSEGIEALRRVRAVRPDAFIALYTAYSAERVVSANKFAANIILSKSHLVPNDVSRIVNEWFSSAAGERSSPPLADDRITDENEGKSRSLDLDLDRSGLVSLDGTPLTDSAPAKIEIVSSIITVNSELLSRVEKNPELMRTVSPRQFEELVAELFTRLGYSVNLTPQTRDGGVDLLAVRKDSVAEFLLLVECKRYVPPHTVGVSLVRSLHGVLEYTRANAAMLVTSSFFSRQAREYEQTLMHRIHLRDYLALKSWLALPKGKNGAGPA